MGKSPSEPSTGVITLLDVMGWKGIYNREQDPILRLQRLVKLLVSDKLVRGLGFAIEVRSISDTIVLFSKVTEQKAIEAIEAHGKACAAGIAESISSRIPIRGATSFGDFEVQENIYVGKAIDEAASWYDAGNWVGVHLTPSAAFLVDTELLNWLPYKPPLKVNDLESYCVNWPRHWSQHENRAERLSLLRKAFRVMGPILPDMAQKFEETIAFAEDCIPKDKRRTGKRNK